MSTVAYGFKLLGIGLPRDNNSVVARMLGIGTGLALADDTKWIALSLGRLIEGGKAQPGIRIGVGSDDEKKCKNVQIPCVRAVIQGVVEAVEFGEPERLDRTTSWLSRVEGISHLDMKLSISEIAPSEASIDSMWVARFLDGLGRLESPEAGVVFLLRPIGAQFQNQGHVKLNELRERLVLHPNPTRSEKTNETTEVKKEKNFSETKASEDAWGPNTIGVSQRIRKGIEVLDELISTGGWLVSARVFATKAREVEIVSALLIGHLSRLNARAGRSSQGQNFGVFKDNSEKWDNSYLFDGKYSFGTHNKILIQRNVELWRRGNVDLLAWFSQSALPSEKLRDQQEKGLNKLNIPLMDVFPSDHIVSGKKLWSLIQLPITRNEFIPVGRGFDYCTADHSALAKIGLGWHRPGGLFPEKKHNKERLNVGLEPTDLLKHTLIVGATGSGKTTTMRKLLTQARAVEPNLVITVLEGAKREYHEWGSGWGMDKRYDLGKSWLELNIFEHPPSIAPDSHLAALSEVFENALDMPPPIPALMREALTDAYSSYHHPDAKKMRELNLHPIRFWLGRALEGVIKRANYTGETGDNVRAILTTRLRALSIGAASNVLAGTRPWAEVARQLTGQSSVLELESIGDQRSRSLVMALFVLYYRYGLNGTGQKLSHLLVLEEAHRIIGRDDHKPNQSHESFGQLLSEVRNLGCGIIISDQSPGRLIEDAMRNTNTKFIMRLVSGSDIEAAVRGGGLPDEAREDIANLSTFQTIFLRPNKRPAIIEIQPEPFTEHISHMPVSTGGSAQAAYAREVVAQRAASVLTRFFHRGLPSDFVSEQLVAKRFLDEPNGYKQTKDALIAEARELVNCEVTEGTCPKHDSLLKATIIKLVEQAIKRDELIWADKG